MSSHQQPYFQYQMVDPVGVTIGQVSQGTTTWTNVVGENPAIMAAAEEKRRLRMIRNRESAARSRARKQAYITQLELDIERLERENEVLKSAFKNMMEMANKRIQRVSGTEAGLLRIYSEPM